MECSDRHARGGTVERSVSGTGIYSAQPENQG